MKTDHCQPNSVTWMLLSLLAPPRDLFAVRRDTSCTTRILNQLSSQWSSNLKIPKWWTNSIPDLKLVSKTRKILAIGWFKPSAESHLLALMLTSQDLPDIRLRKTPFHSWTLRTTMTTWNRLNSLKEISKVRKENLLIQRSSLVTLNTIQESRKIGLISLCFITVTTQVMKPSHSTLRPTMLDSHQTMLILDSTLESKVLSSMKSLLVTRSLDGSQPPSLLITSSLSKSSWINGIWWELRMIS